MDVLAATRNGATLGELASGLKLSKSTAHRILMVLEAARFVERDAVSGRYSLGSRVMELGLTAVARLDVFEVARPHLHTLMEQTGETAHLAVLRESEVVTLMTVESRQAIRAPRAMGARTPAYCTSLGKAILAHSSQDELERYVRQRSFEPYTPKTITSAERLEADLKAVRRRGYAIDDEEWELGLRCVSAPVYDRLGTVVASVGISGPIFRISRERLPSLARAVTGVSVRISESLGYAKVAIGHLAHTSPRNR